MVPSYQLVFVFSGYNSATNVRCCFGKHSKRGDELHLSLLAGSGRCVGVLTFQCIILNLSEMARTDFIQCMCFSGSAAANTLSQIYICAFLFAYIWWKKLHVKTWGGEAFIFTGSLCSHTGLCSFSMLLIWHKWASPSLCRLVCRITAGVGLLHEAGHSQHIHDLLWVVGVWVWRIFCRYFSPFNVHGRRHKQLVITACNFVFVCNDQEWWVKMSWQPSML